MRVNAVRVLITSSLIASFSATLCPAQDAVAPGVWRMRFGEPEKLTPVSIRSQPPFLQALQKMESAPAPFAADALSFRTQLRGCVFEVPVQDSEQIFGLGLHPATFNLSGTRQTVFVSDEQEFVDGGSHAPVPFYVSTRGYGVLIDTARYASFWIGDLVKAPPMSNIQASTSPADLHRGTGRTVTVEVPNARGMDVYFFAGPTLKDAIRRYNLFSGGGYLPPLWGLGVYYRAYAKLDAVQILKLAHYFRDKHIPCDVFGLEPGWQSQTYSCSYTWSKERWPKPDEFIRHMTDSGYNLNLWEHAFVHPTAPFYREIRPFCGDYEVWGGLVPDFLEPQARRIFGDYHAREFVERGITGFKLDECDQQPHQKEPWSFPEFARFPSGVDGEQMHSLFGIVYQQTIADVFKRAGVRTWSQVRSSQGLASPLPFVLYSDYYDHRAFVRGILNAGFCGLMWQPEMRSAQSLEDLYRRAQTAALSPQALVNAWEVPNPPWFQWSRVKNIAGDLMPDRDAAENVIRELFRLRMRLVPYLYSAFAQYRFEGIPPFRALVVDYPADTRTHRLDDQYMMGDSLLVAPIFGQDHDRTVYFPAGIWYDFWTREKYEGPREQKIHMPPDKPPIFVKDGSILPLADPVECIRPDTMLRIRLVTFGRHCRPLELIEDDGRTFAFESGKCNHLTFAWNEKNGERVDRSGDYSGRRYDIAGWEHVDATSTRGSP